MGSGCHSFTFVVAPGDDILSEAIQVRRSLDGAKIASLPPAMRTDDTQCRRPDITVRDGAIFCNGLRDARGPRISELRGTVDHVGHTGIAGWAQHIHHPEAPVCLDIYADRILIGRTFANRYREDLEHAGLGSGCLGFEFVAQRRPRLRCPVNRSPTFAGRAQAWVYVDL
jgi:hypothetical protein